MRRTVTLVDYGSSNLLSVRRAFQHLDLDVTIADRPEGLADAGHLVLPGVGAFGKAMDAMDDRGLSEAVRDHAERGRPFLGICLGMQMMLDESEEFGSHAGLGLVRGQVVPVPSKTTDGAVQKVPHVGWSPLKPPQPGAWGGTVLDGPERVALYFVHSFVAELEDPADGLAQVDYGGHALCAAVSKDNLLGFQAHPEKSGAAGLEILRRFAAT